MTQAQAARAFDGERTGVLGECLASAPSVCGLCRCPVARDFRSSSPSPCFQLLQHRYRIAQYYKAYHPAPPVLFLPRC